MSDESLGYFRVDEGGIVRAWDKRVSEMLVALANCDELPVAIKMRLNNNALQIPADWPSIGDFPFRIFAVPRVFKDLLPFKPCAYLVASEAFAGP